MGIFPRASSPRFLLFWWSSQTETLKNAEIPRFTINSNSINNNKDSILNTTTSNTKIKNDISSSNSNNREAEKIWESLSRYGITRNSRTL